MTQEQIQKKKRIGSDDILDRAGTTELAANLFRITQTDEKLKSENIQGDFKAANTHFVVGRKVRKAMREIGGTMPENLKPETHIKELVNANKKLLKQEAQNKPWLSSNS